MERKIKVNFLKVDEINRNKKKRMIFIDDGHNDITVSKLSCHKTMC